MMPLMTKDIKRLARGWKSEIQTEILIRGPLEHRFTVLWKLNLRETEVRYQICTNCSNTTVIRYSNFSPGSYVLTIVCYKERVF